MRYIIAAATLLAAFAVGAGQAPVEIKKPTIMWVPQIGQVPHAGFFEITNVGDTDVALTGARSTFFAKVDFHAPDDGDVVIMEDLEMPQVIAPGETLVFKRGGPNLMMSIQGDWLEPGDTAEITLLFERFDPMPVTFTVRKVR